ncbi:MAG: hypothetical protein QXE49_07135 [Nitrososphaerota archaeon]
MGEIKNGRKTVALLALIVALGFAIRFTIWIYPAYGNQGLTIFDPGTYTVFGLSYIQAITSMNMTALSSINPGVPPFGMLLTGLSAHALGQFIGIFQAGLLAPITASALTAIPAYMIANKTSQKLALVAPALVALDPFLIQYSTSYLDSIGTLFATTSAFYIINQQNRRALILAIIFASLAILTKLSFAIFTSLLALLLLYTKKTTAKSAALYLLAPPLTLLLSPAIWRPSNIGVIVQGHLQFNNLPLAPLLAPFTINVPLSLPWHILSYLGMGQVSWGTLPHITPLILFILLSYRTAQNRLHIPSHVVVPASAMVLAIFLLPRSYWTYSWGAGYIQGVLVRHFYPYYFYPASPLLAALSASILAPRTIDNHQRRIAAYPALLTALLSPLVFIMNLGMPYWDFLFNLIYSASQGYWVTEGLVATGITTAILATVLAAAEIIYKKAKPPAVECLTQRNANQEV